MPTPQPGVLSAGGAHAYFLTFTVADGAERTAPNKAIGDNLSSARALTKKAKTARLLQITSGRHDLNLDLAMGLVRRLQPVATMAEEIHGFRYRDSRDLTGVIDGTENPKGKAWAVAALIGEENRCLRGR